MPLTKVLVYQRHCLFGFLKCNMYQSVRDQFASFTQGLEGPPDDSDRFIAKLNDLDSILKMRWAFTEYDTWPADAQLGLLSMAWVLGPSFRLLSFEQAISKRDFYTAAFACHITGTNNPSFKPRDVANFAMFLNADAVEYDGHDRSVLHYPSVVLKDLPVVAVSPV